MPEIGRMKVTIGADDSELQTKLREVSNALKDAASAFGRLNDAQRNVSSSAKIASAAELKLAEATKKAASEAHALEAAYEQLHERMIALGVTLIGSVTAPLIALARTSIQSATKMDSLQRGLVSVAGSAEEADRQLSRLKEIAKLPGLGREEAISASISLQAAGLSAELSEKSLLAFGNALATVGKGKAELDGVTLALTQIASKGKISAEEINQIAERVPQIRVAMKAAFGTANTEELQKMGIGAKKFINAIVTELGKLPKVTGGAQNAFENLQDTMSDAFNKIGQVLLPTVLPAIERISEVVTVLAQRFSELPKPIQATIIAAGVFASALGPAILLVGQFMSALSIWVVMAPLVEAQLARLTLFLTGPWGIAIAVAIAAVAALAIMWSGRLETMDKDGKKHGQGIASGFLAGFNKMISGVRTGWARVQSSFQDFGGRLRGILSPVNNAMSDVGRAVGEASSVVGEETSLLWDGVTSGFRSGINVVMKTVSGWGIAIAKAFSSVFIAIANIVNVSWKFIVDLFMKWTKPIREAFAGFVNDFQRGWNMIKQFFGGGIKEFKDTFDVGFDIVIGGIKDAGKELGKALGGVKKPDIDIDDSGKEKKSKKTNLERILEQISEKKIELSNLERGVNKELAASAGQMADVPRKYLIELDALNKKIDAKHAEIDVEKQFTKALADQRAQIKQIREEDKLRAAGDESRQFGGKIDPKRLKVFENEGNVLLGLKEKFEALEETEKRRKDAIKDRIRIEHDARVESLLATATTAEERIALEAFGMTLGSMTKELKGSVKNMVGFEAITQAANAETKRQENLIENVTEAFKKANEETLRLTDTWDLNLLSLTEFGVAIGELDDEMLAYLLDLDMIIKGNTALDKSNKLQKEQVESLADTYRKVRLEELRLADTNSLAALSLEVFKVELGLLDDELLFYLLDLDRLITKNKLVDVTHKAQEKAIGDLVNAYEEANKAQLLLTATNDLDRLSINLFGESIIFLDEVMLDWLFTLDKVLEKNKKLTEMQQLFKDLAEGTKNVFENVFSDLMQNSFGNFFKNVVQGFSKMLQQMAAQYLASQLTKLLFNTLGNMFNVSEMGGAVSGMAAGGRMDQGRAYLVGERGPEIVSPDAPSHIMNNRQSNLALAGGRGVTVNMTVKTNDADSFKRNEGSIAGRIGGAISKSQRRNGY